MRKKSVILSWRPSPKVRELMCLAGWIDGNGRVTGAMNLNDYLNSVVTASMTKNAKIDPLQLEINVQVQEMLSMQRERDLLEERMRAKSLKISEIREKIERRELM
jgi:hypothetical protein